MGIPVRGRKEPPTELERIFWQEFPNLLVDDPDERLNEIIGMLRNTAIKYFEDKTAANLMHKLGGNDIKEKVNKILEADLFFKTQPMYLMKDGQFIKIETPRLSEKAVKLLRELSA